MNKASKELTAEAKDHRRQIHQLMEKMSRQRNTIDDSEFAGKDGTAARQELRRMMTELDELLLDHHNFVEPISSRRMKGR